MRKLILFLCLIFVSLGFANEEVIGLTPHKKVEPPPPVEPTIVQEKKASSSYWKFHHSAYIGYRRDRQQFNAYGAGILNTRTQYQDRNSAIVTVGSHIEFSKIVGYIMGSYGWLLDGHMHFRDPGNSPPLYFPRFRLGSGYNVDARGSLAWRIYFYDKPNCKFSFLPGIGYRYAHMMNFSQGVEEYAIPGTNNIAFCHFPKPNQQDWFGFFADGRFELLCWDFFQWSLFCQYHRPYLVSKTKTLVEIYQYNNAGALISDQSSTINSVVKSGDLNMILGGTTFKFLFGSTWAFGTHFEGSTTWRKAHDHAHLEQKQFISTPISIASSRVKDRATVRWTFYTVSVMVDHRF